MEHYWLISTVVGVLGILVGAVWGVLGYRVFARKRLLTAGAQVDKMLADAEKQAQQYRRSAEIDIKGAELKMREQHDAQTQEKQKELSQLEKRMLLREEGIEKRFEAMEQRERDCKRGEQQTVERGKQLDVREAEITTLRNAAQQQLEKISGLTIDEAKRELVESLTEEARIEAAKKIRQIDEDMKQDVERRAQKVIAVAIERMASDSVSERSISTVTLPNEDVKGRIIGREGRNIRAFEATTGVEVVIDDGSGTVTLSCFNPIRREIARRTLEELLKDGRIHPGRIEEIVSKMTKEVNSTIKEAGEQAVLELGLHRVHPELVKHMGMLRYRYSYAQNVLQHSIDVGFLCGMMATELGMHQKLARRAGFLHDIGKSVTHEVEGSHALIGMEMCKKYGEREEVCHAVGAHHEDIPQESALDCLVDAADALSGARPGARREVLETYMKRLEDLEAIATGFSGVQKSYAIQAGREIRVLVRPQEVNDAQATLLSRDIARKIENDLTYPGQIRVTVIREMRAVELAK